RSANLASYTYTYNNPVRLVDPTGREPEERWAQELEAAIDELPARYYARDVMTNPAWNEPAREFVGNMVEHQFCQRVGQAACAEGGHAFVAQMTMTAAVGVTLVGRGESWINNPAAQESGKLVQEATQRQLDRGWSSLLRDNLNPTQQEAYRTDVR